MEGNWCHFLHRRFGTHPPLLVTVVVTRHGSQPSGEGAENNISVCVCVEGFFVSKSPCAGQPALFQFYLLS